MSLTEYASNTKLVIMLRSFSAVQFIIANFSALLRSNKKSAEPVLSKFAPGDSAIAAPELNDQSEREKLIRRRWIETGIKMWNPDVHGVLNIQGRVELLPVKPGETLPRYDKLEFKLIGGCIVCEGVVVDPPL
jgi:hypothetical protein